MHVFDLTATPTAARAYAWSSPIEGSTKRRFFAVLHQPLCTAASSPPSASTRKNSPDCDRLRRPPRALSTTLTIRLQADAQSLRGLLFRVVAPQLPITQHTALTPRLHWRSGAGRAAALAGRGSDRLDDLRFSRPRAVPGAAVLRPVCHLRVDRHGRRHHATGRRARLSEPAGGTGSSSAGPCEDWRLRERCRAGGGK